MEFTEEEYQELINLGYQLSTEIDPFLIHLSKKEKSILIQKIYEKITEKKFQSEIDIYQELQNHYKNFDEIKDLFKKLSNYSQKKRMIIANSFIFPNTKEFYQKIESLYNQHLSDIQIIDILSREYGFSTKIVTLKLMEIRIFQKKYGKTIESTIDMSTRRKK